MMKMERLAGAREGCLRSPDNFSKCITCRRLVNMRQEYEVVGPCEEDIVELARMLVAEQHDQVQVEGYSNPDDPDAYLYETGALLPGPDAKFVGPTFEEWLGAN